jgi:hypothetical protein
MVCIWDFQPEKRLTPFEEMWRLLSPAAGHSPGRGDIPGFQRIFLVPGQIRWYKFPDFFTGPYHAVEE